MNLIDTHFGIELLHRNKNFRKKIEAEEQKKIEEESLRQHQEEMGNQLPPEPSKDEKNVSQLRFRFPDGRNAIRRFRQSERLQVLFIFIGSEGFSEVNPKQKKRDQP